ncbi:MAG: hypothetical protein PF517_17915 [Salinivirgaceae bacterium]|jgi:hypothetical protein|nr:hypothetical protein [Salinivirgaceae bacterium]
MNLLKPVLLTLILINLCTTNSIAQIESLEYAHSGDTCVPATTEDYNRLIKYFMAEKEDVKQLYKINLMQIAYLRINPSFERKLTDNTSLEFEFNFGRSPYSYRSPGSTFLFPEINYKYYYNKNKRQEKGKNTNGFSGNYLALGMEANLYFTDISTAKVSNNGMLYKTNHYFDNYDDGDPFTTHFQNTVYRVSKFIPNENVYALKIGYGLQRRIGNIGYFSAEAKMAIGSNADFNRLYFTPDLNIKAGFAISRLKKH